MRKITLCASIFVSGLILLGVNGKQVKADTINNSQSQAQVVNSTNTSHPRLADVNAYINENKLPYKGVKDESSQSTFTKGQDYRYGKPEGIVIHETNKPNISAQEWVDKFNNEWPVKQTYVHAFVDRNGVVQAAPTNKTVWGAGYYANQRFIQVELCEENTEPDFAQSIQNDASYVASLLHQYGLKPILEDGSRTGTIWSHHDVSKYLGNTDHTDPDDYFKWHNYSMVEFFNLIKQRYDEMDTNKVINNSANTTPSNVGTVKINYAGPGKVAVWSSPTAPHQVLKYVANNTSWKVFKTTKVGNKVWYNLGGSQWVDGQYVLSKNAAINDSATAIKPINSVVKINYTGRGKVAVWSSFDQNKKTTGKYLSPNTSWKAYKLATIKDHKWYNLGGTQWIDGSYIIEKH